MIDLADADTVRFLHSGCALLVGTVDAEGRPHAARAWGLTVIDAETGLLRLLVEADDDITIARLRGGGRLAVTATSVTTYRSVQLKGHGVSIEEPTEADAALQARYTREFMDDIHESDGYAYEVMEPRYRRRTVPAIVRVGTSFDQTPGPSAGAAITEAGA